MDIIATFCCDLSYILFHLENDSNASVSSYEYSMMLYLTFTVQAFLHT